MVVGLEKTHFLHENILELINMLWRQPRELGTNWQGSQQSASEMHERWVRRFGGNRGTDWQGSRQSTSEMHERWGRRRHCVWTVKVDDGRSGGCTGDMCACSCCTLRPPQKHPSSSLRRVALKCGKRGYVGAPRYCYRSNARQAMWLDWRSEACCEKRTWYCRKRCAPTWQWWWKMLEFFNFLSERTGSSIVSFQLNTWCVHHRHKTKLSSVCPIDLT
jgi:hypothetical protein